MANSFAPQHIIDGSAFMLASHMAAGDWSQETIEDTLLELSRIYLRGYYRDTGFSDDVRHCSIYAERAARNAYPLPNRRAEVLHIGFDVIRKFEPDGSRRKKFLGFLGGHLFGGSHPHPADRKRLFEANFLPYMAMAIKIDVGGIRMPD
jgi:hypothetical protein